MGTGQESLTESQLEDLGTLLARSLSRGSIVWLATSVLGRDAVQKAGNEIGDAAAFARRMVAAINKAERIPDAVLLLNQEASPNGSFDRNLRHILRGNQLDDSKALQAFVNEYQPFFPVLGLEESLKRIKQTICAVALGAPHNQIMGSGFLIGSDLVMTNYHVVETFLDEQPDNSIKAKVKGDQIYCFFDYYMEPPPRVPPGAAKHASTAVRGADKWLVYARQSLPYDGTAKSPTKVTYEYDYAIIRLNKPIGNLPTRQGGGAIRGWLPLPARAIDFLPERRLMVFQHPGGVAQQIDFGESLGLDPTTTRIRYKVSSSKGSSGGAAVDTDGELFALHNAEVEVEGTPLEIHGRVNQGVRIDKIAADLAAAKVDMASPVVPANAGKVDFWSLNDDPQDPQPIIGRVKFREVVAEIHSSGAPRAMVVTGPPGCGVQFSIRLLQRTLGPQVPVVVFSAKELQNLPPRDFLRAFLDEVGIKIRPGTPIPEPKDTENVPRWLRLDLPDWLCMYLDEDRRQNLRPYPIWIVVNAMVSADERVLWAENLKDFVATLTGAHDPGQAAVDLPQLRWLFLGQKLGAFPISGIPCSVEDLASDVSYDSDFAECVQLAWRSVLDKGEGELDQQLLLGIASTLRAASGAVPIRKFLAVGVRNMITRTSGGGGGV